MKKLVYLFFLLGIFTASSCKKNKKIIYHAQALYGDNILAKADGATLDYDRGYSFSAKLGKKANLKIVITNLSPPASTAPQSVWFYYPESNLGWLVGEYDWNNGTQTFTSIKTGDVDLKIEFENFITSGSCKIEFYENSKLHHTNYHTW